MRGFGKWAGRGVAAMVAVLAMPVPAQGRAGPAAGVAVDPDAVTRLYDDRGRPNPHYDPRRHFELEPHWSTLAAYAWELDARRRAVGEPGLPAPDPALDAMKRVLSRGALGAPPPPRRDIGALQAFAAEAVRTGEPDIRREAARDVAGALQLWNDAAFPYDGEQPLGALAAIALPPVRPSLFATDAVIAAGGDTPQALSGRFGIVHRWVLTPATATAAEDAYAALYDIGAAANLLVRPLQRVQLSADGTLASSPSHARQAQALHDDEHGCAGWTPGFALGGLEATDPAWAAFGDWLPDAHAQAAQGDATLYGFYVGTPLPATRATVSVSHATLDPAATGFAAATTRVFDLDHDAVPDLLVWEGTGPGPGHIDGPTGTDDTWYRLVLVNTGGRWKVLGTDVFSYGCGC